MSRTATAADAAASLARVLGMPYSTITGKAIVGGKVEVFLVKPSLFQGGHWAYDVVLREVHGRRKCTVRKVPYLAGDFRWPLRELA